jgi:beta-lactam-binding protein with PASTA domain/tRNA A-37 threonylcarbamoyl transferase component Bud32
VVDGVPRRLGGRYEVGELIGRGGMAEVHVGQDSRLGRRVAIKMLRSDLARDPIFQARFRREAQSAAALNHPSIVAVYDTGEDVVTTEAGATAHVPYIVMEYVEGHTVRELVKDGHALPIDEAVEIVAGVLGALDYSHHAGIVHRDIKPGNVMLTPTGAVKVMDFGIARAMADSGATMTATHSVIGTAQYLSPEQARGEVVDTRSDLYSTGCLLFELLTGRTPFIGDSPVSVAYQHVVEEPPTASSIASDVPEALDRVTAKALAKDRNQRYQTAAEFRADLEAALRGHDVEAPPIGALAAAAGAAAAASAATAQMNPLPAGTRVLPATGPVTRTSTAGGPGGPGEEPAPKRRGLLWFLIVLGLAATAGIVAIALQGGTPLGPRTVAVPDLEGMDEAEARQTLAGADLEMAAESEPSAVVEPGLAIRWEPADEAEQGTVVTVFFSTGPAEVEVPDVSGLSQARARQVLANEGFTGEISTTTVNQPGVRQDITVRTDPEAGQVVSPAAPITLVLASGNVEVPDLTGMPEAEAQQALTDLQLTARIRYEASEGDAGRVINQDRTGSIPVDATVTLTISEAAPSTEPPASPSPENPGNSGQNPGNSGNGNDG